MVLRTVLQPLRFRPSRTGTLSSLLAWIALAFVVLIVLAPLLGVVGRLLRPSWDGRQLQGVSAVLVDAEASVIRLTPDRLACAADPTGQQIVCRTQVDGEALETTVNGLSSSDGMISSLACRARYADQRLPCEAIHNPQTGHPAVVVHSDMGLSPERFQQLATQTGAAGWTERDWLRLHFVLTVLVALALVERLWWNSRQQDDTGSDTPRSFLLRLIYALGGSMALVVAFYLSSLIFLLSTGWID